MADPVFLGHVIEKGVACAAKVVRKVIRSLLFILIKEILSPSCFLEVCMNLEFIFHEN